MEASGTPLCWHCLPVSCFLLSTRTPYSPVKRARLCKLRSAEVVTYRSCCTQPNSQVLRLLWIHFQCLRQAAKASDLLSPSGLLYVAGKLCLAWEFCRSRLNQNREPSFSLLLGIGEGTEVPPVSRYLEWFLCFSEASSSIAARRLNCEPKTSQWSKMPLIQILPLPWLLSVSLGPIL